MSHDLSAFGAECMLISHAGSSKRRPLRPRPTHTFVFQKSYCPLVSEAPREAHLGLPSLSFLKSGRRWYDRAREGENKAPGTQQTGHWITDIKGLYSLALLLRLLAPSVVQAVSLIYLAKAGPYLSELLTY